MTDQGCCTNCCTDDKVPFHDYNCTACQDTAAHHAANAGEVNVSFMQNIGNGDLNGTPTHLDTPCFDTGTCSEPSHWSMPTLDTTDEIATLTQQIIDLENQVEDLTRVADALQLVN